MKSPQPLPNRNPPPIAKAPQPSYAMADTSKNTSRIILILIGIVVLTALVYFAYKYFSEKQKNDLNLAQIEELDTEIRDLEEKISELQVTMEDQSMEMAEKDRLIEEKGAEIEELVKRLNNAKNSGRVNAKKVKQLESKLASIQSSLDEYKMRVEELETENEQLVQQVDSLTTSRTQLRAQVEEAQEIRQQTEERLEETVKVASTLKATDFQFYTVNKRGKAKEGSEFRRGSMNTLRVCFNIQDNPLAETGMKDIYLVVENPDGTVNANYAAALSGEFEFEGTMRTYSTRHTIDYAGYTQEGCVEYQPSEENKKYEKGPYQVTIYCDGKLIGRSGFRVK